MLMREFAEILLKIKHREDSENFFEEILLVKTQILMIIHINFPIIVNVALI